MQREGLKHEVLNAKNHEKEAEIIAQAGKFGAVTIATNMAGRGTDILLGGNPEFMAKQKMRELGFTDEQLEFCTSFVETDNEELNKMRERYRKAYNEFKVVTDAEKKKVIAVGGLHIIGTERHESRRIDNQLRGRAGRQGDPGSSVFYVSMEDELIRRFGGDQMKKIVTMFKMDEDTPYQFKMLSHRIEASQKRIEGFNFSARSNVLRYDDVLNAQRTIVYDERNRVLDGANVHEEVIDMIRELTEDVVYDHISDDSMYDEWNLEELNNALNAKVFVPDYNLVTPEVVEGLAAEEAAEKISANAIAYYQKKCDELTALNINFEAIERAIMLKVVDTLWMDHLDYMNMLRNEIGLRAYGNHDPVIAYKEEGYELFDKMITTIREEVATFLMHVRIDIQPIIQKTKPVVMVDNNPEKSNAKTNKSVVGRNDSCPCGSGKKYKNCCGK